ncbi:MAG: hypothetical protein QNK18_18665 [Gammaproteobacteria bacterium]|nr:hypothetical protein [Gammaproteobacteria bacterium]MDJ0893203.1 hypothetical protein [Gammaproteobacteria bacterium]
MINVYDMASGELLHQDHNPAKSAPQRAEKGQDDASKARAMEQLQRPHPELRLLPVAETERR